MEHLNHCRQVRKQFNAALASNQVGIQQQMILSHILGLADESAKFLLPDGGKLIDDPDLRGLDQDLELRLPFECIALEWRVTGAPEPGGAPSTKRILFAKEEGDRIVCWPVPYSDMHGLWGVMPKFSIPKRGYLERTESGAIRLNFWFSMPEMAEDIRAELNCLLELLNALQCTNVAIERSEPKKANKNIKAALRFDVYHVLTIRPHASASSCGAGGSHRSPREHLRRGHIRRLGDRRKVWVSATVVAASRGGGVVSKSYAMQGPTP